MLSDIYSMWLVSVLVHRVLCKYSVYGHAGCVIVSLIHRGSMQSQAIVVPPFLL